MRKQFIVYIIILSILVTLLPPPPVASAAEKLVGENFIDIKGHWAEKTVAAAKKNETINGYEDGSFKPDQDVSRAEFVTFVNKGLGLNPRVYDAEFRDVSSTAWYAKDIAIGQKSGYIQGYNRIFRPDVSITREEAAVILHRLMNEQQPLVNKNKLKISFTDANQIANWSRTAVEQVTNDQLMDGYPDGTFQPKELITRAETLVVLERYAKLYSINITENKKEENYLNPSFPLEADISEDKPVLIINSPTSGSQWMTRESQVTLGGIAKSRSLKAISYETSDGQTGQIALKESWELPSIALNGEETKVSITLTDMENHKSTDAITIIKDARVPELQLANKYQSETIYVSESEIELSGTAFDNQRVESISYTIKSEDTSYSSVAQGTNEWSIPRLALTSGVNEVIITAQDKAGNSSTIKRIFIRNDLASFQGELAVSNQLLFVKEPHTVTFTVPFYTEYVKNDLLLYRIHEDGKKEKIAVLNDDGNLYNGDDIGSDGIYSTKIRLDADSTGEVMYQAVINTHFGVLSSNEVKIETVDRGTKEQHQQFIDLGEQALDQVVRQSGQDATNKKQVVDWLLKQPNVEAAGVSPEGGSIWYESVDGMRGGILVNKSGIKGSIEGGAITLPEAQLAELAGISASGTSPSFPAPSSTGELTVGSGNVLIASPFASKGLTSAAYDDISDAFKSAHYNVNRLKDEAVTVETFKKLSQYGVIILDTHGELFGSAEDKTQLFLTGEKATAANLNIYETDMKSGRLVEMNGYYAITPAFISAYNKALPSTIVFNGSCLSVANDSFASTFLGLGALSYLGYSDYVEVKNDQAIVRKLFLPLVTDKKSLDQAYEGVLSSDLPGKESIKLMGSAHVSLTNTFFNTSFEEGDFAGWTREGDVRAIAKLGSISPTQGKQMAIISTGLGSVNNSDSYMERSIEIPAGAKSILFDYNILSEEPMEWLDTEYDDEFQVILEAADGKQKVLTKETVSTITKWEAVEELNLDGGDQTAYMTGWKRASVDVSGYAGEGILHFQYRVWDRGDTDYDTAVLMDNIKVSYFEAIDQKDADKDGLPDLLEKQGIRVGFNGKYRYTVKTSPDKQDTDGDGLTDGAELIYLQFYNSVDGGFFEAIDHPNSKVVSLFARDIYAELESIVDLKTESIDVYKENIIKAENYKTDLLAYSNRIMNYHNDLREGDRSTFLIYLSEIRLFIDVLNSVISTYADYILSSTDDDAKIWLLNANISLMDSEFGEGVVINPLKINQKIGIENYVDNTIYSDEGPRGKQSIFNSYDLTSNELKQIYEKELKTLPITPYESYEYVMNEESFDKLINYMEAWWILSDSSNEDDKKYRYQYAIEGLRMRNNPCSYVPGGCGDGTATFEKFFDRYFYIQYKESNGTVTRYSIEPDLGVIKQSSSKRNHIVFGLVEPGSGKLLYVGRTANIEEKQNAIRSYPKFLGLEWTEIHNGEDYLEAKKAEQTLINKYRDTPVKPKLLIGVRQLTDRNNHIASQLRSIRNDLMSKRLTGEVVTKEVKSFSTKKALLDYLGPADSGDTWHFIAPDLGQVSASKIYSTANVVILPYSVSNDVKEAIVARPRHEIMSLTYEALYDLGRREIEKHGHLLMYEQNLRFEKDSVKFYKEIISRGSGVSTDFIKKIQIVLRDHYKIFNGEADGKYSIALVNAFLFFQHAIPHKGIMAVHVNTFKVNYKFDGIITAAWVSFAWNGLVIDEYNRSLNNNASSNLFDLKTLIGIMEGMLVQVIEEGMEIIGGAWSLCPLNPKFYSETIPQYYQLLLAIVSGQGDEILGDMLNDLKTEYVGAFNYIKHNTSKIWGKNKKDKPTYKEAKEYGKNLAKLLIVIVSVVSVTGAAAKLSAKGIVLLNRALQKVDEVPSTRNKVFENNTIPCNCFTAGTKVLTDEGEKPIEEIEVGDKVLAKSDATGEVAYKEVVGLFQKQADEIYKVHIGDEVIEATAEHPFWLDGKGWTEVKDMKVGDLLLTSDGATLAIDGIEKEAQEATVYNFEVEDFQSYFVSDLRIWVHNCLVLKLSDLGSKLGSGGNKNVYAYGKDKAVGVLKPGINSNVIDNEIALLKKINEQGLPTVNPERMTVDGEPAMLMDRFELGSKDVVRTIDGVVKIVGQSKLLNKKSIEDLKKIRKLMIDKKIRIHDLQFLIGKDGRVVIADPLDILLNTAPSKSNLDTIDLLIKAAENNL
ncbi:S-layer homology domain-containing protein [Paenibacillus sp. L3-i20]|uniref:S-layer homology domain-containing protein n=1 Tax=Paenibacillus sp. L3-i20 TaxID=2905833 RepID=UPI001EDFA7C6|nr:S-layer homology domain-containing protein [Paenibacillus sp. L3-i20]GKU76501.1 hypothetical protein L3i20_v208980 [Paenibacillus sp. L3-i20]